MNRATVPLDLAALPSMSLSQLRAAWSEHMARATPPSQRRMLIRELAWRLQERRYGGLDAATARLLKSAMRKLEQSRGGEGNEGDAGRTNPDDLTRPHRPPPRERTSFTRRPLPALEVNTRLVRTWRGVRHEVIVLEGGRTFRYRDHTYDNLSVIARAITGVRWSGPRFFGLKIRAEGGSRDA